MGGSMTKILPGLFVGGLDNAKNEEELMANCISHILIVQDSKNDIEKSISRQYLHLIVSEKLENSLLRQIQLSNDFIHRARLDSGNVLEDLQILHSALNSHLNSTEDPDFLFNNNIDNSEYDKTLHKDEEHNVNTIGDNDRIMTPTIIPNRVVAVEHNLVNDSIQTMVDTSSVQSVIQHNIRHSLSDSDLQQLDSILLDKEKDITLLNSSNGNNNHTDNVNDERGGNDLDNIPLVSVPVNDAIFPVNSLKPSPDESDVFVVDPTQLPKNWDHISHTSSSIKSDNSLEIGFELKDDDIDDNVPGAIEIPTIDSIQIRNRGESHTYNNHHPYSHSNLSRSMHHNTIAHSLYPPPSTTTTNMNDNLFTCQSMFPTTNVYNFNHRINSTDINDLQSFNLSSTALNYDIFSRLDVS
ncbi:protein phosphatase [Schistosoma japonicum]|nr:protein phosphatase [Schistosoma japonicum]